MHLGLEKKRLKTPPQQHQLWAGRLDPTKDAPIILMSNLFELENWWGFPFLWMVGRFNTIYGEVGHEPANVENPTPDAPFIWAKIPSIIVFPKIAQ